MRYVSQAVVMAAALTLQTPAAHAIPMTFAANLTGAAKIPPVASPGFGQATVVLDPTAQTIQINATFSGLTSNDVAAHIHCCAPLDTNVGVATTVPAFPGFPLGVTSGSYSSAVLKRKQTPRIRMRSPQPGPARSNVVSMITKLVFLPRTSSPTPEHV